MTHHQDPVQKLRRELEAVRKERDEIAARRDLGFDLYDSAKASALECGDKLIEADLEIKDLRCQLQAAKAQRDHYRSALEFYADYERNYFDDQPGEPVGLDRDPESGIWEMDDYKPDRGERARTALSSEPGLPEKQGEATELASGSGGRKESGGELRDCERCGGSGEVTITETGREPDGTPYPYPALARCPGCPDCTGKEVGVGAGQEREPGVDRPGNPTASVDSNLDPVEQFKWLRDELLGEETCRAAARATFEKEHPEQDWRTEDRAVQGIYENRAANTLAAAWDHATGHAPLPLPADSNLDQGGDDDGVAAGAAVDVGGGPETSRCLCGHPRISFHGNGIVDRSCLVEGCPCEGFVSNRPVVYVREQEGMVTELFATVEEAMKGRWTFPEDRAEPWQSCDKHLQTELATAWSAAPVNEPEILITEIAIPPGCAPHGAGVDLSYIGHSPAPQQQTSHVEGDGPRDESGGGVHDANVPGPTPDGTEEGSRRAGAELEDAIEALLLEHASNAAGESFLPSGADVERLTTRIVRACLSTQPVEDVIEDLERKFKAALIEALDNEFRRQAQGRTPANDYHTGFDAGIREVKKVLAHPNVQLLRKGRSDSGGGR